MRRDKRDSFTYEFTAAKDVKERKKQTNYRSTLPWEERGQKKREGGGGREEKNLPEEEQASLRQRRGQQVALRGGSTRQKEKEADFTRPFPESFSALSRVPLSMCMLA